MANETSKQMLRRSSDRRFATRWFVGTGIDIGSGPDPLSNLADFLPLLKSVRPWDLEDGDAMLMAGVPDDSFDFVHSSHCLEHLVDPFIALQNWLRICRPGGHLIVTVPDEDLYEQGVWPSTFNEDHKWTFTILKSRSWSPRSINVLAMLERFADQIEILKVEKLDSGFVYGRPRQDQTLNGLAESSIEVVVKKKGLEPEPGRLEASAAEGARFAQAVRGNEVGNRFAEAVRFHQAGQLPEARVGYLALLALDPENKGALNNLALLSPPELAEQYLIRALALDGNYVDALLNLAGLFGNSHRQSQAKSLYQKAHALAPQDRRAIQGLFLLHEALEEWEPAMGLLDRMPTYFDHLDDAYCRVAKLCENTNRPREALGCLEKAIRIHPANVEAHIYAGRQYLKLGDYRKGAEEIAWIWHGRIAASQIGAFVDEAGRSLDQHGRTIVLSADSGLGDTLQFVRYAGLLKALGATVVLECQPELERLMGLSPMVDRVHGIGHLEGAFDLRVPLHNLIGAFRTTVATVPAEMPYLNADPEEVRAYAARIGRTKGLKIGLVWSGNRQHPRDVSRSIPPAALAPLLSISGATFFSLQKEPADFSPELVDWSQEFTDMAVTAALVQNLDLVITIDSAVAHLAGALGRPVWLLNRFDSCWRWLEERTDSPWYPTLRIFRQAAAGPWDDTLARVAAELGSLIQASKGKRNRIQKSRKG